MPHLFAGLITCGLTAAALLIGRMIATHLEQSTVAAFAPELFPLKTQGLAFQHIAARAPDVLPLYGSSELLGPVGVRASDFFRTGPTDFQVSPVGKPGATSLILLQKLGALARDFQDKKVAVSMSSVYFCTTGNTPYWYEGNFSLFAVSQLTFGSALDFALKREIAARLLEYPRTLDKDPLVKFALSRLASGRPLDQLVFWTLWPLGKIENAVMDLQDHFEAMIYILRARKSAPARHLQTLDWPALTAKAEESSASAQWEEESGKQLHKPLVPGSRDAWFRPRMTHAPEWADFELLLRTLTEIHARPLLISMPLDGRFYDTTGLSRSARQDYYEKMRAAARRYNFALVEFEEHDDDARFLDHRVPQRRHVPSPHLTAKGWMFYNRILDDFFHEPTPRS
jgi:D-alanine transfer protein